MYNVYIFAFRHHYLQCPRSWWCDMSFNITNKFLFLYIKFPSHGFSMNCDFKKIYLLPRIFHKKTCLSFLILLILKDNVSESLKKIFLTEVTGNMILCEKCPWDCVKSVRIPNFLIRAFPHSEWVHLSVFSPH